MELEFAEQLELDGALSEDGVRSCLMECGLTEDPQQDGWIAEGMSNMEGILSIRPEEVFKIGEKLQKLPANRGGSRQGTGSLRKVQALVRWCMERKAKGENLDSRQFTEAAMLRMLERIRIEEDEKDTGLEAVENKVEFKPTKWKQWKLGFQTALGQLKGVNKETLTYVIRPRGPPLNMMQQPEEIQRMYMIGHRGPAYHSDNKVVWNRLKMELLETEGWAWIQKYDRLQDGRTAWLKLCDHYDGPGEVEKRIAEANKTLASTTYKSEKYGIKFETYTTKIMDAITTLQENGVVKQGFEQVAYLLNGIDSTAPPYIHTATAVIQMDPEAKNDFTTAANRLAEYISKHSNIPPTHGQRGGRRIGAIGGRGRGRNGPGRGRGRGYGRGRGRGVNTGPINDTRTNVGGVDVSNPTRSFTSDEYGVLIREGYVGTLKRRRQEAHGGAGNRGDTSTTISSLRSENETLTARIAALEGAYRGQTEGENNPSEDTQSRQSNGTAFGAGAYKRQRNN